MFAVNSGFMSKSRSPLRKYKKREEVVHFYVPDNWQNFQTLDGRSSPSFCLVSIFVLSSENFEGLHVAFARHLSS